MELTVQRPGEHHYIHSVSADGIRVVDQLCTGSIIVSANRLITDWPVKSPGEITADHVGQILDLEPEIVLIGTGPRQVFLQPEMLMQFYKQGVGVEIMSTRAACDTFNIIVSEGRNVVAALVQVTISS
ncbi:MAG: Mth938-like domain-containing protein [Lysobacterales bacterium]